MGGEGVRKRRPYGYWSKEENRRAFLEEIAPVLGIADVAAPGAWAGVTTRAMLQAGGRGLLLDHGSVRKAVAAHFPRAFDGMDEEGGQEGAGLARRARGGGGPGSGRRRNYWASKERREAFAESLARDLDVREAADWSRVRVQDVIERGGAGLLRRYNNSLRQMVADLYPELARREHFVWEVASSLPRNYFDDAANRRLFMESLQRRLGVRRFSDWKNVSYNEIIACRGAQTLLKRYGFSVADALADIFPEEAAATELTAALEWRPRVRRSFWDSRANRRAFLDKVARTHSVVEPGDWRNVTTTAVMDMGGRGLLAKYGNLLQALLDTYEDYQHLMGANGSGAVLSATEGGLQAVLRPRLQQGYWKNDENVASFMKEAGRALGISKKEDWYRVSADQLCRLGGAGMLRRIRLVAALRIAFPKETWSEQECSKSAKKTTQRTLYLGVRAVCTGEAPAFS